DGEAAWRRGSVAVAAVSAGECDAEDGGPSRGFRDFKLHRPGGGAAVAPLAPHVLLPIRKIDPAEALIERVLRGGILPGIGGGVRNLFKEPVAMIVALADCVGDVVGEEIAVAERPSPQPVVGTVAFVELVGGSV